MRRLPSRTNPWLAMAVMGWCAWVQPAQAATFITATDQLLDQAESLRSTDHARFVQMLEQIHREAPRLSRSEQWRLRYLDAWETMFEGDYAKSEVELRDVIDHSGDTALVARASSQLLNNLATNRRYEEAYALANRLTSELPQISDRNARFALLTNLSQMMDFAGQIDLAIQYARLAQDVVPRGESLCYPLSMQVAALSNGKQLTSSNPLIQQTIDTCTVARKPVFTNAAWLILGSLYLDENQPDKAMALLDRIGPAISASRYYPQMLSSQVVRAQAYAKLGDDKQARQAALAALAMSHPGDVSEWLMTAYDVLYQIEKKHGNHATALAYYEQYVAQNAGNLSDVTARTLAYEVAKQHVLQEKLETETLSKQNNILRLEQALDRKAVEASRLYIVLLLLALVSIFYWLLRIKRSQLRFKQLSSLDGLTGILNHQNFMIEADRTLRTLEKKQGAACLVYVDLDYFKQVNDTHGHAIGDAVLRRTVAICRQHLRPTDLFGRLGGEEFGILLLDCSSHQGAGIADRIRVAIEGTSVDSDGDAVSFSASVGLASTNRCGYNLHKLCKDADAALYRAKRTGRNRVISDSENGNLVEA
jgi:diguanylate cyclase (GGDEF)-like protein